jgi:hypothetical protein
MLPQSDKAIAKIEKILLSLKGEIAEMIPSEINHNLDRLDKAGSALTDAFIAEGRGHELPSETFHLSDPLALAYQLLHNARSAFRIEISRRYGPGAPSRLPTRR